MGWCSATEIMDTAVGAAEALLDSMRATEEAKPPQSRIDEVLSPYVGRIAAALRDGDWDCIEESVYFGRFRQEMLGYDDERMVEWYREQIAEVDDSKTTREYSDALISLLERMGW